MSPSPTFHLALFGSPSIEDGAGNLLSGRVVQRHRIALLALLVSAPGQRLSRDKLLAYLWPDSDAERGRNLLKVATYVIRGSLGEDTVLSEADDLRLNPDVVSADTVEFTRAIADEDHGRAVALYRGPFMDGFFLSDAPEFEQWASRERARLVDGYAAALERLAETAESRQDASSAADLWKRRAAQDPYDSRVAVRLMKALEASGNPAGALQHASVHERLLLQEFGMAASPEVASMTTRLRREGESALHLTPPVTQATPAPGSPPPSEPEPTEQLAQRDPLGTLRWGVLAFVGLVLIAGAIWRGSHPAAPERSIAVLPFVNLTAGSDDSFSDGLTEEITTGLSRIPQLKVISRTSAMHYKASGKSLREIAGELGVAHILEGSVRQSNGRVRISTQLIDARADVHRWAQNYDSDVRDVLGVQEQIAREVVRALEIQLGEGRTALVRRGTEDSAAYELFRRGRYLWGTRTREGHLRAIEYYRQAIARDSSYADAYAGIAGAYLTAYQLNLFGQSEAEMYSRVKWAAEKALAADDNSADAHTLFAISLQWQRNWLGADREFRRAIELNPNDATSRSWYSLLLSGFGGARLREALEQGRRAYELDPFAVVASVNYGWQCHLSRDADCAVEQQLRTVEIGPMWGRGYERLGLSYAQKGRLDEALVALQKAIELDSLRNDFDADMAYVLALRGDAPSARAILERVERHPFEAFNIGMAYVALGQRDSAFTWLERASWQWPHRAVLSEPALDPLRSDPRFAKLAARIEREMGLR